VSRSNFWLPLRSRRKPLALSVAALFALSSPLATFAVTIWTVDSCSEANSGTGTTGTLRFAAANALDGDKIDMSALPCSTITLKTGAIVLNQPGLNVAGPGMHNLTITGMYNGTREHDRIFTHTGGGQLSLYDFSVSSGYVISAGGAPKGGCIYSAGALILIHTGIYGCSANTSTGIAYGGGVFAKGSLRLKYSVVSNNVAFSGHDGTANGGGAMTAGDFFGKYSTISGNAASGVPGGNIAGYGGGLYLKGNVNMFGCTISGNSAYGLFGGVAIYNRYPAGLTAAITNSTISGNTAQKLVGGLYVNTPSAKIYNSTIAFNHSAGYLSSASPGLHVNAFRAGTSTINLQSVLIANNTNFSGTNDDFSIKNAVTVTGNYNLVRATGVALTAPDNVLGSCPLLGPLRFNGGPTKTHALLSHSPGIDQGNNVPSLKQDQRGVFADVTPYPYPRVDHGQADIGAYEVQQGDIVFNNAFDACL
jgi:hypothetical protein